jgi:hypothetical protein
MMCTSIELLSAPAHVRLTGSGLKRSGGHAVPLQKIRVPGKERHDPYRDLSGKQTHRSVSVSCAFVDSAWTRMDFHQFDMPSWHILEKAAWRSALEVTGCNAISA